MSDPARFYGTINDLQTRIAEAGCVFEFTISSVSIGVRDLFTPMSGAVRNYVVALLDPDSSTFGLGSLRAFTQKQTARCFHSVSSKMIDEKAVNHFEICLGQLLEARGAFIEPGML